jgi:hypothetical protein
MRFKYLRTNVYSDTLFSEHPSSRMFECAQLFVTDHGFCQIYPMCSKSDAPYKLDLFCKTYGLPQILLTDNAPEETKGEWLKVVKQFLLIQHTVEPHSAWQNRAELEIRELKKHFRRIMHRSRCPEAFWCYGLQYTCHLRQLMARPSLEWRTPYEILTGDTPDCTEYINFDFYSWVKFRDPTSGVSDDVFLGKWLGVATTVGQAMTYWILKSNGYVIARSTVRPLTDDEIKSTTETDAQQQFLLELKQHVNDFDPALINTNNALDDDNLLDPPDQPLTDLDSDDPPNISDAPLASGPEPLIDAQVILPRGDRMEIARVIGRKRGPDGFLVGRPH